MFGLKSSQTPAIIALGAPAPGKEVGVYEEEPEVPLLSKDMNPFEAIYNAVY